MELTAEEFGLLTVFNNYCEGFKVPKLAAVLFYPWILVL